MNEFALSLTFSALARGLLVTAAVTMAASLVAVTMGLVVGLCRVSPRRSVRWPAIVYIEFFRGTSLLVQLYWWFFVLPIFGVALSPWTVAIFGIGVCVSSYGAELVRAAIRAVDRGQYEASIALNFSRATMMRRIIVPQAIRAMLPAWGTLLIELLKGTSLVFFITISEFTSSAKSAADATGNYLFFFAIALLGYYIVARGLITPFVRWLESHLSRGFVRITAP
ncbi:ABC-type amino acid transport system, permease component [Mesorhizobium metallidurans STM 2683]|uniref:ABC-type amino acid transport system, permease component n=1 Tax=Mesorhizobium metallidurans STM 2683 TaxID=1297569 RepID=M5FBJ4_9HYPH|nr:ectoine/hydroxyectoine ABC transporter permease subunit EhuC [Mesorhizobium metallidurans]CCV09271.1 ABC-type amino acid transport system, permease component [Mesorhizobium metallidurans STM 2683]